MPDHVAIFPGVQVRNEKVFARIFRYKDITYQVMGYEVPRVRFTLAVGDFERRVFCLTTAAAAAILTLNPALLQSTTLCKQARNTTLTDFDCLHISYIYKHKAIVVLALRLWKASNFKIKSCTKKKKTTAWHRQLLLVSVHFFLPLLSTSINDGNTSIDNKEKSPRNGFNRTASNSSEEHKMAHSTN